VAAKPYFYITSLPPLGELGSVPPVEAPELVEHVSSAPSLKRLLETILLSDDLVQREAFLSGEVKGVLPAVLSGPQTRNEAPLPEFLAAEQQPAGRRIAVDVVWENYYRHAATVARESRSRFLGDWTRYEVTLRNVLAAARARALGLEPTDYLVAADLGGPDDEVAAAVGEWSAARDPLAGLRALDAARWRWLQEHEGWYSFVNDELAAYAAKLMLVVRWQRIAAEGEESRPTLAGRAAQP